MWHEARKQEKKLRGIMVDYKRRAERRREFYEKIRADPTQFLQLHGRPAKIHLDSGENLSGDSPAHMMPWQGRPDVLIDRFDVRAHLDYITDPPSQNEENLTWEDRMVNYERYRIIVQNDFLGLEEEKFLQQLNIEEQFGSITKPEDKKKKDKSQGAAIPYTYEDSTTALTPSVNDENISTETEIKDEEEEEDSDIDFDLSIDVTKLTTQQAHEMNNFGANYGMYGNDFYSLLTKDIEEKESLKLAREHEEEKAMFHGRKSRRERRAFREKRLVGRKISPPSYAARTSPTYNPYHRSNSRSRSKSRSCSPVASGQITYITSFGGEEENNEDSKSIHSSKKRISSWSRDQKKKSRDRSPRNSRSSRSYRRRSRDSPVRSSRYRRTSHNRRSSSESSRKSHSPPKRESPVVAPPPPPIKRYYGSRKDDSSSDLTESDNESKKPNTISTPSTSKSINASSNSKTINTGFGNKGPGTKSLSAQKTSHQERLKRRMQVLLNKQYKADKKAEKIRYQKQEQERQDREDELREMAIKLRRRERQRRHRMHEDEEDEGRYSVKSSSNSNNSDSSGSSDEEDEGGSHHSGPERKISRRNNSSYSPDRNKSRPLVDY